MHMIEYEEFKPDDQSKNSSAKNSQRSDFEFLNKLSSKSTKSDLNSNKSNS